MIFEIKIQKKMNQRGQLLGLCGRYGAGKSTIASYLTHISDDDIPLVEITGADIEDHVIFVMYGAVNNELRKTFVDLFRNTLDTNFEYPKSALIPINPYRGGVGKPKWIEICFADALKCVAAIIFQMDYNVLRGIGEKNRAQRDLIYTPDYNIAGRMNGRKCLEYLGTEVFRNHFHQDIWIDAWQKKAELVRSMGINVVVSDVRFPNEFDAVMQNGDIAVVFRNFEDLILRDEDKLAHPAAWKFLECLASLEGSILKIHNNSSIEDLYAIIDKLF